MITKAETQDHIQGMQHKGLTSNADILIISKDSFPMKLISYYHTETGELSVD